MADPAKMDTLVAGVDGVLHLAGVNRAEDEELLHGNVLAAQQLAAALSRTGFSGRCVYASSTHESRDNAYGRGKRQAGELLTEAAEAGGWAQVVLIVPNVYGEYGRPDYNSGVATFAHRIVAGEDCEVNAGAPLELVYVGDLVAEMLLHVRDGGATGAKRIQGLETTVGSVHQTMCRLWETYAADEIPSLETELELRLFNMLRGAAFPRFYPRDYNLRSDHRGRLAEVVRARRGGQVFFSSTQAGATRGNHYHLQKVERFAVVQGEARISIRRLFDDVVHEFDVCGDKPAFIDMPTLHTHSITNTGDGPLLTLFWAHEFFDPDAPDTYPEPVYLDA